YVLHDVDAVRPDGAANALQHGERTRLVVYRIEREDDVVCRVRRCRIEVGGIAYVEAHVVQASRGGLGARPLDRVGGEVDAVEPAGGEFPGEGEESTAAAAADVEYANAASQPVGEVGHHAEDAILIQCGQHRHAAVIRHHF